MNRLLEPGKVRSTSNQLKPLEVLRYEGFEMIMGCLDSHKQQKCLMVSNKTVAL